MDEYVLLESSRLRQELCTDANIEVLTKVGQLVTLPNIDWTTTEQVARFYQVSVETIKTVVKRSREELVSDGYKVISYKELCQLFCQVHFEPHKKFKGKMAIFSRKAVLRIGMLLKESTVAKKVRTYLLEIEEQALILNNKNALVQMANELEQHSLQLAQNANQLQLHSTQLGKNADELAEQAEHSVNQSRLIAATISEVYKNREHIGQLKYTMENHIENLHRKVDRIEQNVSGLLVDQQTISPKQLKILKARVSKLGNPVVIWRKFNKHFAINRYINLPENQFEEALEWLEKYQD